MYISDLYEDDLEISIKVNEKVSLYFQIKPCRIKRIEKYLEHNSVRFPFSFS